MMNQLLADKQALEPRKRVAWGITGSGDKIGETVSIMEEIEGQYRNQLDIGVYVSKAGEQVLERYGLVDPLQERFGIIHVEIDSNTPFLVGALQAGRFEFLLIAPATSNTVAKISNGIADSLLTNSAIMALKAFIPVYIMPSDYKEGTTSTRLPGGKILRIRIRKEDVSHVERLSRMEDVSIVKSPKDIRQIFKKHFQAAKA